jgi:hypothetical protein
MQMKVYYGFEKNTDNITVIDRDEDFIISHFSYDDITEAILLLYIQPRKTSKLIEDYGFFSESRKCYLYLDMICAFSLNDGEAEQTKMFLLQLEEELIAEAGDKQSIYFLSKHNKPLVQKWAEAYQVMIEFILL